MNVRTLLRNAHVADRTPPTIKRWTLFGGLMLCLMTSSGCSLMVMAGKMLFGDPLLTPAFTDATHVDLVEDEKSVLVICETPDYIKNDFPSVDMDLLDAISRRLKRQGIHTIRPDDVASWIDRNGGTWDSLAELADEFEPDYIIHVDVDRFSYREDNSPDLLRGRSNGTVFAYEVRQLGDRHLAAQVFAREFRIVYPTHNPSSPESISGKSFRKKFLDRVSDQVSRLFYSYRLSETL